MKTEDGGGKWEEFVAPIADRAFAHAASHPGCHPIDAIEAAIPPEMRDDESFAALRKYFDEPVESP